MTNSAGNVSPSLARRMAFRLLPALSATYLLNYLDRFKGSGSYRFEADGDGTLRRSEGELSVKATLVGRLVEQAIVSGLGEHLADETTVVERWLAERAS